ncbi:MAG: MogA/MoaB family molybdenum cofactor biosynthesis protein [Candidatus Omnitrophica bacterium]|nr:MogA/MoaB family molybdenum cofactor biosynthesis protein [Candidatus Omnitrophota bacterium]MBU1127810.1 MogA/MoaB family molybdenum cofactor biosynthesis protein [Candidatus Omnitrophota bacterium]MBU1784546.1 MogA/MoaB family molybdenum cofactor biosynthesis protein [Candidatus Omnitrophota bacterium]MBU1851150.1 MogA/MoaB family molybdenum cofactor biosynthesis protein [Candidatus Omnitrophota bacterium]
MIKTGILTISDTRQEETDASGKVIRELLEREGFGVSDYTVVRDEVEHIKDRIVHYADVLGLDLVLTNGGTGLGPRDLTPEATLDVADRQVPGIPELMRMEGLKKTDRSILSRGVAVTRKNTLIINLPGSPRGAEESLRSVLNVIPHAIDMIKGKCH